MMGSLIGMDIAVLSNLLESCHNCTTENTACVDLLPNGEAEYLKNTKFSIIFNCCENVYDSEGIYFTLKNLCDEGNNIRSDEQNGRKVKSIDIPEVSMDVENVIIKCEDEPVLISSHDNDDSQSIIIIETDPLSFENERGSSPCVNPLFLDHQNNQNTLSILGNNQTNIDSKIECIPKMLNWSDLGIRTNNNNNNKNSDKSENKIARRPGRCKKYPDTFTCEFCGKIFCGKDRAYQFQHHRNRDHTREMIYKCQICSKQFWGDRELSSHMSVHTSQGHVCHVCGIKFVVKKHLTAHILTHYKPQYNCNYCNKKFRRKDHLKVHERIHTGDRPYQCQKCGLGFSQKHQLRLHIKNCPLMKNLELKHNSGIT